MQAHRTSVGLILILCLLGFSASRTGHPTVSAQTSPVVVEVRVKGRKLIVTGENFSMGAAILVNGATQKTRNDDDSPTSRLVAPKGAKNLVPGEIAAVTVRNADGTESQPKGMFGGRIITLDDSDQTVEMQVGDRFMVFFQRDVYEFDLSFDDPTLTKRVDDSELLPGAQGVFEAERSGSTTLTGVGSLPCHKSTPPCEAPSIGVQVHLVIH